MKIEVRIAKAEDYEAVNALLHEVHVHHLTHRPDLFRDPPDGILWTREQYLGFLEDPNQVVFLAEAGGEPVGFAYAILREAPPIPMYVPRCFAIVDAIGVTPSCRGSGIGKLLMRRAEQWGKERGATGLELTVHTFNHSAIAFYESLGMKATTQRMHKPLV